MTKFLKGDATAAITLALADGFDYSGKTVHLEYQGARRSFSGVAAGGSLTFSFTAAETAPMSLGAYPVRVWMEDENGGITTIKNADVKLCVTDSAADVHSDGAIYLDVRGGLYGIEGLPERYTDEDLRRKIHEILRRLGGTVAMLLVCALPAFCAGPLTVQTAPKGKVFNDAQIVTNVDFDVSDLVTTGQLATAVGAIPAPDFTVSNDTLVATIKATAPAPGNYAAVSIAAMSAVQPSALTSAMSAASLASSNYTDAEIAAAKSGIYGDMADMAGDVGAELRPGIDLGAVDFFVSAEFGSDDFDGSMSSPFRSLDRAYSAATNGATVGVFPGAYPYPEFYCTSFNVYTYAGAASKRMRTVALFGSGATAIDIALNESPKIVNMVASPIYAWSGYGDWTEFEGFTFRGCRPYCNNANYSPFWFVRFRDCAFEDMFSTNRNTAATWCECMLERCVVKGLVVTGRGEDYEHGSAPGVFASCIAEDCVIEAASTHTNDTAVTFATSCGFSNCFVSLKGVFAALDIYPKGSGCKFEACTILGDALAGHYAATVHHNDDLLLLLKNCLVGIDEFPWLPEPFSYPVTNIPHMVSGGIVTNRAVAAAFVNPVTLRAFGDMAGCGYAPRPAPSQATASDLALLRMSRECAAVVAETEREHYAAMTNAATRLAEVVDVDRVELSAAAKARGVTFNHSKGDDQNVAVAIGRGAVAAVDEAAANAAASNTVLRSVSVAIGANATARANATTAQAIAVGWNAQATGSNAIAIGSGAQHPDETAMTGDATVASGGTSVAIGYAAKATAKNAVQLGQGVNSEADTLKFFGVTIVRDGKLAAGLDTNAVYSAIAESLDPTVVDALPEGMAELSVKSHAVTTLAPTNNTVGPGYEAAFTPTGSRNFEVYVENTETSRRGLPFRFGVDFPDGRIVGPWATNRVNTLPFKARVVEPIPKTLIIEVETYDDGHDWTPVVTGAHSTNGWTLVEGTNLQFAAFYQVGNGPTNAVVNPLYPYLTLNEDAAPGEVVRVFGADGAEIGSAAVAE